MHRSFEWRTLLELAQDQVGIREVLERQDAHSLNQVAFDLPSRLIAKIYLFRTIYRGTGWSFANDPDFMHVSSDPKFWDAVGEKFYGKYNGIDRCHMQWRDLVMAGRSIHGPLGREWAIEPKLNKYSGSREIPWTTLTNYPVQGTGADIMMLARISFSRRLDGMPTHGDVKLVSTVHDSIVVDVQKEEDFQNIVNLFHQVFDDIPMNIRRLFGYNWIVPMDCEVKLGLNMKTMEKIKRTDK